MRVISGSAGSVRLLAPDEVARPTTDRVKEGMFNVIQFDIALSRVLDLFAGSGALGIEALSRGAKSCVFVDECAQCIDMVKKNLEKTKLLSSAIIRRGNAIHILKTISGSFDIIFLDPPYKSLLYEEIAEIILKYHILAQNGIIVVESDFSEVLKDFKQLFKVKQKKYGNTYVTYFKERSTV